MESIYESYRDKVYYTALLMLSDSTRAAEAASWVFKNVWGNAVAQNISSEEEFENLALRKTLECCKRKINKKKQKAFRVPENRDFSVAFDKNISDDFKTAVFDLTAQLPELHRFILVLNTVAGFSSEEIADLFKLDVKTIDAALEAQKKNFERALKSSHDGYSFEKVAEALKDGQKNVSVPKSVDKYAASAIDSIAAPLEKKKKKYAMYSGVFAVIFCMAVALGFLFPVIQDKVSTVIENNTSSSESSESEEYEPVTLDESLTYYADINIKDHGTITVKLDQEAAPITMENFVNLAQSGFYDGLKFHRIMDGFMMQGGDPNGDGTGGSENTIVGEFSANGYDNTLSHTRGAISMARSTDYDSASSQFFIVQEDSTFLDGEYAAFGYVTEGMNIVDTICQSAEPTDDNGTIEASQQPVIESITIRTE